MEILKYKTENPEIKKNINHLTRQYTEKSKSTGLLILPY